MNQPATIVPPTNIYSQPERETLLKEIPNYRKKEKGSEKRLKIKLRIHPSGVNFPSYSYHNVCASSMRYILEHLGCSPLAMNFMDPEFLVVHHKSLISSVFQVPVKAAQTHGVVIGLFVPRTKLQESGQTDWCRETWGMTIHRGFPRAGPWEVSLS